MNGINRMALDAIIVIKFKLSPIEVLIIQLITMNEKMGMVISTKHEPLLGVRINTINLIKRLIMYSLMLLSHNFESDIVFITFRPLKMISVDDIVLPDTCITSCGLIAEMLNPDFDNPICIYSRKPTNTHLQMEDLKRIDELLIQYNKVVLEIDIAGWFDHTFTLYNTNEGIYVVDSYVHQKTVQKRPFDLDKLYEMLIEVSKYIGVYEKDEIYDFHLGRNVIIDGTSAQTFNECAKIWYNFWNAHDISGARGNLDYYIINCYKQG